MSDIPSIVRDLEAALRSHIANGYGKIVIDVSPGRVLIQQGLGNLYDIPKPSR